MSGRSRGMADASGDIWDACAALRQGMVRVFKTFHVLFVKGQGWPHVIPLFLCQSFKNITVKNDENKSKGRFGKCGCGFNMDLHVSVPFSFGVWSRSVQSSTLAARSASEDSQLFLRSSFEGTTWRHATQFLHLCTRFIGFAATVGRMPWHDSIFTPAQGVWTLFVATFHFRFTSRDTVAPNGTNVQYEYASQWSIIFAKICA